MRTSRMTLALLGALLALGLSSAVQAQTVTQNGQSTRGVQQGAMIGGLDYADSSLEVPAVDPSTHALYVVPQSLDRDYVHLWEGVIQGSSLALAAADSMAQPLDVHAYRYLKLLIKATPVSGDTVTNIRLAFQFREHMNGNSDTSSVFAEYMYGSSPMGITEGRPDTSSAGHLFQGNAGAPWSGEYVVNISAKRSSPGNSISVNGRLFSYPNGIAIPFDSFFGRPVRFNWLSVRMRNIGYVATAQSAAVKYSISILGFAE